MKKLKQVERQQLLEINKIWVLYNKGGKRASYRSKRGVKGGKKFKKNHKDKIEVFFIPPYSPKLNPQEYVNQDLKTNIIGEKRAINKEQFRENINNFMNKRKPAIFLIQLNQIDTTFFHFSI